MWNRTFPVFVIFVIAFFYTQEVDCGDPVIPEHYNIKILVLFTDSKFEGIVDILVECKKETDNIKLHAASLNVSTDKITVKEADSSKEEQIKGIDIIKEDEFLVINLASKLTVNKKYSIHIEYEAELKKTAEGFYINEYKDENETFHQIANTHFEPIWARCAFPSFDLPHMKATFEMTIGRHKDYFTLNNMPLDHSEPIYGKEDYFWDHYQKTPRMSTYLVAWAVLDYGMKNISCGKITFWIPPDSHIANNGIIQRAGLMLKYLEDYFDMEYALEKLDFVVVKNYPNFAGACENWGLVIMQENSASKRFITKTVAHELVHQWIGNIITMNCFGELWLKEGITSYFENIVVEDFDEEQTSDENIAFSIREILVSCTAGSHLPLSLKNCPDSFNETVKMFNTIVYEKGSLLTRMIHLIFGKKEFRKTTKYLLNNFKFQNFDEADLWRAVKETIKPNDLPEDLHIDKALGSWTKQYGFPLVELSRDYEKGTATLEQSRLNSLQPGDEEDCWWIPVSYTTKSNTNFDNTVAKKWMKCPKEQLVIENLNSSDWIIINLQSAGLFVVKYDDDNFKLLTETLTDESSFGLIPFWDKYKIIIDSIILSNIKKIPHHSVLDILLFLKYETNKNIWNAAFGYFSKINWLADDVVEIKNVYMKMLIEPHFSDKIFNFKKKSWNEKSFALEIIKIACDSGFADCRAKIFSLFEEFKQSFPKVTLEENIRKVVLCLAAKYNVENAEFLKSILPQIEEENLLDDVQMGIICTCSSSTLRSSPQIKSIFKNTAMKLEYRTGKNPSSIQNMLFQLIQIFETFLTESLGYQEYIKVILEISDDIHDPKILDHLKNTFKMEVFKYQKEETEQIIKCVESNIEWKSNFEEEIRAALQNILEREGSHINIGNPTTIIPEHDTKKMASLIRSSARSFISFKQNSYSSFLFIFLIMTI